MPLKHTIDPDKQTAIWYMIMTNLVFELLKENTEISGDTLATKFRESEVPPHIARKGIPNLIRSFKQQGWIKLIRGKHAVSSISGKLLPVYQCLHENANK